MSFPSLCQIYQIHIQNVVFKKYSNIVFRNIDHVSKGKNHQSGGGTVHKTQRIFNKFKHIDEGNIQ